MDIVGWMAERYDLTHKLGNWAARGVLPALEGVSVEMADWHPAPDQHTIAESVAHMAYHAELVAARLRGDGGEYRADQDWQAGSGGEEAWAQTRARLERAHGELSTLLRGLSADQLLEPVGASWLSAKRMIRKIDLAVDIATHDLYHAGQIFVLKRLFKAAHP
jgi:uncharacterized damage-inducible protein DinB